MYHIVRLGGRDYVDIFYHHRPDPDTPLGETMTAALDARRTSGPSQSELLAHHRGRSDRLWDTTAVRCPIR
jgi:aryl-alcohol dehydrogenase-like predicted oxidoreductase